MGGGENLERELLQLFYEKYYKELYAYIFTLSGNRTVTEDVLQETFLKAFTALKDSHTNIRAWLYLVARNLYYNYARSTQRRQNITTQHAQWTYEQNSAGGDDMLEGVLRKERQHELQCALRKLSEVKREIMLLQYFGGFSQKEIAAMLKLSPENVRVLSHRARKELRQYLEVNGHDLS